MENKEEEFTAATDAPANPKKDKEQHPNVQEKKIKEFEEYLLDIGVRL